MLKKAVITGIALLMGVTASFGAPSNASAVAASATPTAAPAEKILADNTTVPEYEEYRDFLSENYDIDFGEEETVSQSQFQDAVDLVYGEESAAAIPADIDSKGFNALEAVLSIVYYANLDELSVTYNNRKVEKTLEYWINIPEDLEKERKQELSVAIDSGLLTENWNGIDFVDDTTSELATELFANLLAETGKYKHYSGYISDDDISSQVLYIWNSFDQVSAPEFQAAADDMVKEGIVTGYNIKRSANRPMFDRQRTIVYGHSSIAHALQLIDLLDSEGLDGKVMLEPKTSAYLYLKEWGEPEESPEFQVEPLPDGNYIAYAKEYDLSIELMDEDYKVDFDELILKYAKKSEDKQEGLIIDSWWQPLYSSETEVDSDGYTEVKNNLVENDGYFIQSFSLDEDSGDVIDEFEALYPGAESSTIDLWVNQAFYRYLQGEAE